VSAAAEVMFYEFDRKPLEAVLPLLLEKTLQRGWRAVVQVGDEERLEALDTALWTYSEESFLPHGAARDGSPQRQPIFLTTGDDNPNGASVRFLAGGARASSFDGYERVIYLFDGRSAEDKARAREVWKEAKGKGHAVTYWQQSAGGRWEKKS
jgi:DNA polymerase-3 subunit chi